MGSAHVRALQAAYRSIMPDDYLDGLRAEDRASMWRDQIDATGGDGVLMAVADDEVVGFAAFGPCQDHAASVEEGQLYAINLDPDQSGCTNQRGWTTDGVSRDDEVLGVSVTELRYRRQLT
jgi:hypothetical protein